jgi:hypothetical protein
MQSAGRSGRFTLEAGTRAAAGPHPGPRPLLHATEGDLSRRASASAAEAEGLPVLYIVPESTVGEGIATAVSSIGRAAGPHKR